MVVTYFGMSRVDIYCNLYHNITTYFRNKWYLDDGGCGGGIYCNY